MFYWRQDRLSGTPVYVSLYWFTSVGMDVELDKKGIFLRIGKIQILSHGAILVALELAVLVH